MKRIGLVLTFLGTWIGSLFSQAPAAEVDAKINGMSLVAINGRIDSVHVAPLKSVGATYAGCIPYAYMPSHTWPELVFNMDWQWQGERIEGVRNYIHELRAQGIAVMIKPQIWIGHGTYTGTVMMTSEEDWLILEENYRKYIIAFAELAEEEKVESFCIGTELKHFVELRDTFWRSLIVEVRTIYSGKLTYAANWDDYKNVLFWDDLDYIGVNAYFPIAKREMPKLDMLIKGWEPHKMEMDAISEKFGKQILFTEYGYRSIRACAVKPWDYSEGGKVNEKAQHLALKALYEVFWNEPNYAGGFLWKWYPDHRLAGGSQNNTFTIQNKKAQNTVSDVYNQ
jgi:hypothetical protein